MAGDHTSSAIGRLRPSGNSIGTWALWTVSVGGDERTVFGLPECSVVPPHLRFAERRCLAFDVLLGTRRATVELISQGAILRLIVDETGHRDGTTRLAVGYEALVRWLTDPAVLLGDCVATEVRVGSDLFAMSFFEGQIAALKDGRSKVIGRDVMEAVVKAVEELTTKQPAPPDG